MYEKKENTIYQVRTWNNLSETFKVMTGLKHGDALSPLLFNITLEKVVRKMQELSVEGIKY